MGWTPRFGLGSYAPRQTPVGSRGAKFRGFRGMIRATIPNHVRLQPRQSAAQLVTGRKSILPVRHEFFSFDAGALNSSCPDSNRVFWVLCPKNSIGCGAGVVAPKDDFGCIMRCPKTSEDLQGCVLALTRFDCFSVVNCCKSALVPVAGLEPARGLLPKGF